MHLIGISGAGSSRRPKYIKNCSKRRRRRKCVNGFAKENKH
jgi:hypothetical protein